MHVEEDQSRLIGTQFTRQMSRRRVKKAYCSSHVLDRQLGDSLHQSCDLLAKEACYQSDLPTQVLLRSQTARLGFQLLSFDVSLSDVSFCSSLQSPPFF